jgi:hypothetical protein
MKQFIIIVSCLALLVACSSSKKTVNKANYTKLVGQNEIAILKIVGTPSQIEHTRDGGKVMIYEYTDTGMFLTPKKTNLKINPKTKKWSYTSNVNKASNAPEYTIYQESTSKFKAYIDKNGTCVRVDGSLPQEYMETRYEQFKHFKQ